MQFKSFILDPFQEEAAKAIEENKSIVVSAPTGSGKTLIADYAIMLEAHENTRIIYTAPIKALSNQKYKDFCRDYGAQNVGLLTGDIVINHDARILVMTTEIYRNMAVVKDALLESVAYVVFDEIHYINDIERGYIWEESIIFSPANVRFLCLSATIPNAREFADWIATIKQHTVIVVKHTIRAVPLDQKFYDEDLGITTLEQIDKVHSLARKRGRKARKDSTAPNVFHLIRMLQQEDKLPALVFVFSRADTEKLAEQLAKHEQYLAPAERSTILERMQTAFHEMPSDVNRLKSAHLLRNLLPHSIGFHHAGLLPGLKNMVEDLFSTGLIKVLFTTETFAVGINYPARTVIFKSLRKFDGMSFRYLNSKEYFQIAGRAGRRGIDISGLAVAMLDPREDDAALISRFTTADTEPLKSQFRLSYNTVLNMIAQHSDKEIDTILVSNFFCYQKTRKGMSKGQAQGVMRRRWTNLTKILQNHGFTRGNTLTEKGEFARKMFADELEFTEIFGTRFHERLSPYQILLVIAALCYEKKPRTKFEGQSGGREFKELVRQLKENALLKGDRRFNNLYDLTAIILPLSKGEPFLHILKNTNLLEGDLIRIFRQVTDRIMSVKKATDDESLQKRLHEAQAAIDTCFEGIGLI